MFVATETQRIRTLDDVIDDVSDYVIDFDVSDDVIDFDVDVANFDFSDVGDFNVISTDELTTLPLLPLNLPTLAPPLSSAFSSFFRRISVLFSHFCEFLTEI